MDAELRAELLARAEQDKAIRLSVISQRGDSKLDWESVFSVDAQNVAWLKTVVAETGFGTQAEAREDGYAARHLRDPERVDERRAAMSLGPLNEYLARMAESYGPPRPGTFTCGECGGGIPFWPLGQDEARQVNCGACGWTATVTAKPATSWRPGRAGSPGAS
jgi:hypothetical protein